LKQVYNTRKMHGQKNIKLKPAVSIIKNSNTHVRHGIFIYFCQILTITWICRNKLQ